MKLEISHPEFGLVNYSVLVIYLLAMLGVGVWCSRRIHTTRGFFVADGRMHYVTVGLSLLGTYLSALTMMALSGVAFGPADLTWTVQLPVLLLTAFVITRWMLPRYREAGVVSVYEFLEQRIHVSSRLLAASCFCVFGVARMGIVLYLPALAFHIVTGFNLTATILIMGIVITLYTVIGGMEAVIWTDAIQVVIFAIAAVLTVGYIFAGMGDADFWAIAAEHHKLRMFDWRLNLGEMVTAWLVLQTVFETIRIYGTQQDMTQRYATTPSTAEANRSVWLSVCGYIPLGFLFYFIGAALFVFYQAHPDPNVEILVAAPKTDAIYPYFIASQLPPGIAGGLIAAIFAAAMSSIDSLLNSTSTVVVEDFYRRWHKRARPEAHYLLVARVLTVVLGLATTLAAVSFINDAAGMVVVFNQLMGILTNGVLGLMALAFLPFRVNRWAAVIGFVASYLCLFYLLWGLPEGVHISFLLRPVICNPVCFGVALAVHYLVGGRTSATAG